MVDIEVVIADDPDNGFTIGERVAKASDNYGAVEQVLESTGVPVTYRGLYGVVDRWTVPEGGVRVVEGALHDLLTSGTIQSFTVS